MYSKLPVRFFFYSILHIEDFEYWPIFLITYAIDYYQTRQYTPYYVWKESFIEAYNHRMVWIGRDLPDHLVPNLLLMQPRTQLAFWDVRTCSVTGIPKSFSAGLLSIHSPPSLYFCIVIYSALVRPYPESCIQPSAQERHGSVGAGSEEGHNNDQRAGTPLLWGKAERAGAVQPGKEKAPMRPYCGLSVIKGGL